MRYHALALVTALMVTSGAWGAIGEGHYVGKVQGKSKAYRETCPEISADVTVARNVVTGTTKRTIQRTGSRTVSVDEQPITGKVASGGKGTVKILGKSMPVDLSSGRLVTKYAGTSCDYDFDLAREK
ncbi:MAG TPA: hypothetical protein VMB81_21010 [Candidatus Sulfotelmatobacter sp.]|nr:hypothetical protein [Candidatus Sulfotelmatobacter sp.]